MTATAPATAAQPSSDMRAVLERLQRDAGVLFGNPGVGIAALTWQARESSEVSRVRVPTAMGVRHVFAKIFRPRPGERGLTQTRARFHRDFEVTRSMFEAFPPAGDLRSVEPIVCYEDLLALVTNEAPGQPLHFLIGRNAAWPATRSRLAPLELALSRVGRWVAAFQRVARNGRPSTTSLDATREYIDTRLKKLTSLAGAAFDEEDRRELLAWYDRRAGAVPKADLVEVAVHGDIVPSNVIAAPDGVTVLDFGMTGRGSRYLDIARLYTQLEFYRAKPQYRPGTIARLQHAALDAFEPGLRPDHPMFEICAVQHVVCHLLSHTRQPGTFPASVYSSHQCRRHRRWLRERTQQAAPQRIADA